MVEVVEEVSWGAEWSEVSEMAENSIAIRLFR